MKSYIVPYGRMGDYLHKHPERTAYRFMSGSFDCLCKVWSNRTAMLQACLMSRDSRYPFRPLVKEEKP